MILFDLHPRAPLHVGDHVGINRDAVQTYVPSDTLFAAMMVAWARAGVDLEARVDECRADPPALLITSAFPRAGNVRFYPRPEGVRDDAALEAKARKRVRWVSPAIFERLIAGQSVRDEAEPGNFVQGGSAWLTRDEAARLREQLRQADGDLLLWREQIVPRVSVDRAGNASNLFSAGRLMFAEGCGLWFMAQGAGQGWAEEALNDLQDSGVGWLRATGHGAFTFTTMPTPGDDQPVPSSGYAITLSRYAPNGAAEVRAALQAEGSAFKLVTVGGWCQDEAGKAWRRKRIRMVAEGSCLGAPARGRIANVMPDGVMQRRVYRFGLAFKIAVAKEALLL